MNKGIMLGALGLAIIGIAMFSSGAFASTGRVFGKFGQNYSPERHNQMIADGQRGQGLHGQGMRNGERGQNRGGNFVDKNGDGVCDRMQ